MRGKVYKVEGAEDTLASSDAATAAKEIMLLLNMIVNAMFSRVILLVYVGCIVEGLACYRTMGPYNEALSSAIVARQLIVRFCSPNVL